MIIDCHCHAGKGDGLTGPWDTNAPLAKYLRRAAGAGIDRTALLAAFHSDYMVANREVARIVGSRPDRFYGFDDATYAGARVIEILSKTDKKLSELLSDLPETWSTPELRVDCPDDLKFDVVTRIAAHFSKTNKVITIDGARILFDHGWGLVRASNTQAILVLRFEADSDEHLRQIRKIVETKVNDLIPHG